MDDNVFRIPTQSKSQNNSWINPKNEFVLGFVLLELGKEQWKKKYILWRKNVACLRKDCKFYNTLIEHRKCSSRFVIKCFGNSLNMK